jgi:thioredoxin-related protein
MNVDIEIYFRNILNFFETHPDQLVTLIGSIDKEKFYDKIRNVAQQNFEKSQEPELTRKQMVDLVWELHVEETKKLKRKPFITTEYGTICLN